LSNLLLQYVISKLNFTFDLKYLSALDYFLGIESLFLSQSKYIHDFLDKVGMSVMSSYLCPHLMLNYGYLIEFLCLKECIN